MGEGGGRKEWLFIPSRSQSRKATLIEKEEYLDRKYNPLDRTGGKIASLQTELQQ